MRLIDELSEACSQNGEAYGELRQLRDQYETELMTEEELAQQRGIQNSLRAHWEGCSVRRLR